uniref:ABC transporter domain-containing protein n=1 Tax=Physcomitrium patens TaxID=3218 RepID=A0A2K1K032_PHYPA|nr:hypothetical protein PHYPA_014254 [Physcomitrium patens]
MTNADKSMEPLGFDAQYPAPGTMKLGMSPLSQTLCMDKTDTMKMGDVSARLTWVDLWVTTKRSGSKQIILQGITGYAEPGSISAIMGPSGSGKSTLLDTLAGRLATNTALTGQVRLNGHSKTTLSHGTAGYVTQTDVLIGTLTVKETIDYSACLRLPSYMTPSQKKAIVYSTIQELGLHDCRNTPVGNWHTRGLSGGEKRRLSIALEILARLRLLFLDEPTTGLDSAAAFFVITTLRNLSRDGRTIIASIHQPSGEVFEMFDSLTLLSGGKLMYFGHAYNAIEHFKAAGFPCPSLRNPSDHFLRAINADFDKMKSNLKGSFRTKAGGSQASFFKQSLTLTRRSFVNMSRDFGYYWLRLVIYIIISFCVGSVFFNLDNNFGDILVFNRERQNGHYGVVAFVVGNTVSSIPFLFLIALVSSVLVYYMAGLHSGLDHFAYFVISLFAQVTIAESLMMAIASLVSNFLICIVTGAAIQGVFMLLGGFFMRIDKIPKPLWRYPLSYISFDMYALQGIYLNEFTGLTFENYVLDGKKISPPIPGWYAIREMYGIKGEFTKWQDISVLFAMILSYRIIFLLCIKLREKLEPFVRLKFTQYRTDKKLSSKHSEL